VAVVPPIFDGKCFIEETLRSVLGQTYTNFEVWAVDDSSADTTPAMLAKWATADPRVKLHQQWNRGMAAARNFAISVAHGKFIAPMDADHLWFQEKIAVQVDRFEEMPPEGGLVYVWAFGWMLTDAY